MTKGAKIVLVLVAILSITYVLITPDLTDDVAGILRPNHTPKAKRIVSVSVTKTPIAAVVPSLLSTPRNTTERLSTSAVFDLTCVNRC